jgi:Tol biopolymer transport system component
VQHVGGGEPIRITKDDGDEEDPSFSPDGSKIAYHSTRNGGGLFVVPALGGEPRFIAPVGNRPRFSPDGASIAYWTGAAGGAATTRPEVYVVPANGGEPRRIAEDLRDAAFPTWSSDGKLLMVVSAERSDWFVVPKEGGPSRPAGIGSFRAAPGTWMPDAKSVLCSSGAQGAQNIWRVPVNADGVVSGPPERVTSGSADEDTPSVSNDGHLVFSSQSRTSNFWSIPMDPNMARRNGEMRQLTRDAAFNERPMVTADGRWLIYVSDRTGNREVWLRDLDSNRDRQLTTTPESEFWPTISDDASRAAYSTAIGRGSISIVSLPGGPVRMLPGQSQAWTISPDGRWLLIGGGNQLLPLEAVDTGSMERRPIASHREWHLLSPRFSPDGKWLALHVRTSELMRQIYAFPVHPDRPTPFSEWVAVTDGRQLDRDVSWSPNGDVLYWLADRDGARGIVSQKLDPVSKRPAGPQNMLLMTRGGRRSLLSFANTAASAPTIAKDKIIFALTERTGNIWLTQLPKE